MLPKVPLTTEEIERQESIECMFWLLYSADMQLMIRFGGYPVRQLWTSTQYRTASKFKQTISDDLVMYRAPSRTTNSILCPTIEQSRWQVVRYRYARLLSVIVRTLYSNAAVANTPSETAVSVSHLSRILEAWRVSIPKADRPPDGRTISEVAKIPRDSNTKLDLFFRYAEAAFAIHRWSSVLRCRPSGPVEVMEAYSMSQKHCLNLSKGIIDLTNTFHTNDAEIDWYVELNFVILSLKITSSWNSIISMPDNIQEYWWYS